MHCDDNTFDVFISYARIDNKNTDIEAFVAEIKKSYEELFSAQIRIFFDAENIEHGDDWNRRLSLGLKHSHLMLAFLSENYMNSEWCCKEWRIWCEVERSRGWLSNMLLPVLVSPIACAEERIRNYTEKQHGTTKIFATQASADTEHGQAFSAACLVDMFSRQLIDISSWDGLDISKKQEHIQAFVKVLHKKIQLAQMAQLNSDFFMRADPNFCGRIHELKTIRSCYARPQKGLVPIIHGVAGEGKTALAIAYGHAFAYDYPGGRFLVHCEGLQTLKSCFYQLACDLDLQLSDISSDAAMLQQVWNWLEGRQLGRCLVIFDHIDAMDVLSEASLASLIRPTDKVHILATTRNACHSMGDTAIPIGLTPLPAVEALRLFELMRPFSITGKKYVLQIIETLGAHALSLQLAGAFLRENSDILYEDFAQELMSQGVLSVLEQTTDVAKNVNYAIGSSIEKLILPSLEKCNEEEKTALQLAALLWPQGVVGPWIEEALQLLYPDSMRKKGLKNPWLKLVRKFNGLCLWQEQEDKKIFHMHRLVREVILQHAFSQERQADFYLLLHDVATERADEYRNGKSTWPLFLFLRILPTLSLWFATGKHKDNFLCVAEVLISKILRGTGHEARYVGLVSTILDYVNSKQETLHNAFFTAIMHTCRGQCFLAQGAMEKALADYSTALNLLENTPYDKSSSLALRHVELLDYAGEAELACNNVLKAREFHLQALALMDGILENPSDDVLQLQAEKCYTLDHIAHSYALASDDESIEMALQYYMASLQIREDIYQKDNSNLRFLRDCANSYDSVAYLHNLRKEHTLAYDYYEKALKIRKELQSRDENNIIYQRDLSVAYNNKGHACLQNNELEEATSFFEKALALRKKMLDKDADNENIAYDYSFSMLNMGDVCLKKAQLSEAIEYYDAAIQLRKQLTEMHPGKSSFFYGLAVAYNKCAEAYLRNNDVSCAKDFFVKTHETLEYLVKIAPESSEKRKKLKKDSDSIQQKIYSL